MLLDFEKNEKKRNLGLSEDQIFLNELHDSDDLAPEERSHMISGWDLEKKTWVEYNLNDFYSPSKTSSDSTDFDENPPLTAGQIKQIELELKVYLGVSEGWNQTKKEDDEFEHYKTQEKSHHNIIIPPDFKDLIPTIKSERQNEYPILIKRLREHKKLTELASACKSNPKTVEKSLEKLFTEMKNLLKIY